LGKVFRVRILRYLDRGFKKQIQQLHRRYEPLAEVASTVTQVLAEVRKRGDDAVLEYTEKFGGPRLRPKSMRVSEREIAEAVKRVPATVHKALSLSHRNVQAFAKKSLRKTWKSRNAQGVEVGERFDPFQRVGIYVPGGTAPLVSTAIMTATLAAAARVPEIVVTTPAGKDGKVNDALLAALKLAGATEVYRIGGAQAIGALAYGTKTIAPVAKIFGPGNAYVVEAKRQVFGTVAVDLLPGPSEILVIADETASAPAIAADLLAQAEHGKGSLAIFLTDSEPMLGLVAAEMEKQLANLSRKEHLEKVLKEGTWLVRLASLEDAVELANEFAPEHLTIMARDEEKLAKRIRTAGAIFIGHYSPVAGGDFAAGPSHELPTGGAGKSFPGLTVEQFQRRTSIVRFSRASLEKTLPIIRAFGEIEGLDAHKLSAAIRLES
jgi:histidinol dehydrogenase